MLMFAGQCISRQWLCLQLDLGWCMHSHLIWRNMEAASLVLSVSGPVASFLKLQNILKLQTGFTPARNAALSWQVDPAAAIIMLTLPWCMLISLMLTSFQCAGVCQAEACC